MKKMIDGVEVLTNLKKAFDNSYYFIAGAGGDLQEWVNGYNGLLKEQEIGEPVQWFTVKGEKINDFAFPDGWTTEMRDCFPTDLTCLLFPLEGLDVGKLAMFKLQMQDRWFDDVISNMRSKA